MNMLQCVIAIGIMIGTSWIVGCSAPPAPTPCYVAVYTAPHDGEAIVFNECTGTFEQRPMP